MNQILISLVLLASAGASAGQITASGTHTVSHAPEFIRVQYSVQAYCYEKDDVALNTANTLINNLKAELQKIATEKTDEVSASATSVSYTDAQPVDRNGEKNTNGCQGGYTVSGYVVVKLTVLDSKQLAPKFKSLQEVGSQYRSKGPASQKERLTVTQQSPQTYLSDETTAKLAKEAQVEAVKKYGIDLDQKLAACGISPKSVTDITPSWDGYNSIPRAASAYRAESALAASAPSIQQVNLDLAPIEVVQTFSATVTFTAPFDIYCASSPVDVRARR